MSAAGPPPRHGWRRFVPDVSFRVRLLIALAGSVGLLSLANLAVVGRERQRQVDWTVQRATARAGRALEELERFRRADLARVARRLTGSIRVTAALDAAIGGDDLDEFIEQVRYELALAELREGLVTFTDATGLPIVTLVDNAPAPDHGAGDDVFAKALAADADDATGYRLVQGRLYSTQTARLELFGEVVGSVTVGFPLDDDVATRLGAIVESDLCVSSAGRCLAATPEARIGVLAGPLLEAAASAAPVFTTIAGRRLALVPGALAAGAGMSAVLAVPLDDVLRPFDRIGAIERASAAAALLVALVLGLVLATALSKPIRRLARATERVARGDYEFEVEAPGRDELGALAVSFNQMLAGLRLVERYRGVLGKVVSTRIAEELMKGDVRLGGETREVSTLFADLRGFTTLTERAAPESVLALLNEWLEVAAEAIEMEGGVVDKYVGDQVMAIFGAPIPQPDHAARAVRAGLRLRDRTDALNRVRQERGEEPLGVGIGINSGPAVAGNTGSQRRLNYTVLGASVNAASRLCSEAGSGELLISEDTHRAVAADVDGTPMPSRTLKGFSSATTPYAVQRWRGLVPLVLLLLCAVPDRALGQWLNPPTLAELGLEYVSPTGRVQVRPSLRLDLDGFVPQDEPAWHLGERDPFVAGRASLFVDVMLGRHLFASTELRADRGQPARAGGIRFHLQQAFVRLVPRPGHRFSVEAGKLISPFGHYPRRAHTADDPFVRPPLPYDYRTVMSPVEVPGAADGVFTWKNRPPFRAGGLPAIWDVPYPIGAAVSGGTGPVHATIGVTNTAPSADPADWNTLTFRGAAGPSAIGRVTWRVAPELQVGASYSRGSYMRPDVRDPLGPLAIPAQNQEIAGLEASVARGHLSVHGELLFNRWEVFRATGSPRDLSYYAEARVRAGAGIFGAVRVSGIRFRKLGRSGGTLDRWDYDVRRLQIGAGYRLGPSTELRAEYMVNSTTGRADPRDNLLSVRWSWTL